MENNQLITKDSERIKRLVRSIDEAYRLIEKILPDCRPLFNADRYLSDKEVGERLSVCRRTLQDWRDNGIVGYIKIGGKVLYSEREVMELVEKNYHKPFVEHK